MLLKTIDFGKRVRGHCSYLTNKVELWSLVQIPYGPEFFPGLISIITSSVVFIAARISYIRFFTAVHIYMIFVYLQSLFITWMVYLDPT